MLKEEIRGFRKPYLVRKTKYFNQRTNQLVVLKDTSVL